MALIDELPPRRANRTLIPFSLLADELEAKKCRYLSCRASCGSTLADVEQRVPMQFQMPPASTPCEKLASLLNPLSRSFAEEIREGEVGSDLLPVR
jgi:hypothetical protein